MKRRYVVDTFDTFWPDGAPLKRHHLVEVRGTGARTHVAEFGTATLARKVARMLNDESMTTDVALDLFRKRAEAPKRRKRG